MGSYGQIPLSGIYPHIETGLEGAQGAASLQIARQQAQALQMQNQMTQIQLQNQQIGQQAWQNIQNQQTPQVSDGTQAPAPAQTAPAAPSATPVQQAQGAIPISQAPVGNSFDNATPSPLMGNAAAGAPVPLSQALSQGSPMPGAQQPAQAQPRTQAAAQQQQPAAATGVPTMDRWIDEMQRLGASPAYIMQARTGITEYMKNRAALTSEELKNQATVNDVAAGTIQSFAKQDDAYKQANWPNFRDSQVRNGAWTVAQAKYFGNAYPGDAAMKAASQLHLAASQIDTASEKQGVAARGQAAASEALSRQQQNENQQAAATFPSDPKDLPAYQSTLPTRVQQAIAGKSYADAQATVQHLAIPPADWDKKQEVQSAADWDYVLKAAKAGQPQYNAARDRMAIVNPQIASLLGSYDPQTTIPHVQDMALNPQQSQQAGNQGVHNDAADARNDLAARRVAVLEQGLADRENSPDGMTSGQRALQNRFDQRQYGSLSAEEQRLHALRSSTYAEIANGKDSKGNELSQADIDARNGKVQQAGERIQQIAMQKGQLMKLDPISPADIAAISEGASVPSSDPSMVWKKQGGIVYPEAAQGTAAVAAPVKKPVPSPSAATVPGGQLPAGSPAPIPTGLQKNPPPAGAGKPSATPQSSSAPEPKAARPGQQHAAPPPGQNAPAKGPASPAGNNLSYNKRADGSYVITTPGGKFTAKNINDLNTFLKSAGYQTLQ